MTTHPMNCGVYTLRIEALTVCVYEILECLADLWYCRTIGTQPWCTGQNACTATILAVSTVNMNQEQNYSNTFVSLACSHTRNFNNLYLCIFTHANADIPHFSSEFYSCSVVCSQDITTCDFGTPSPRSIVLRRSTEVWNNGKHNDATHPPHPTADGDQLQCLVGGDNLCSKEGPPHPWPSWGPRIVATYLPLNTQYSTTMHPLFRPQNLQPSPTAPLPMNKPPMTANKLHWLH